MKSAAIGTNKSWNGTKFAEMLIYIYSLLSVSDLLVVTDGSKT